MIEPSKFFNYLIENEVTFFTGVPDSLLKNICGYITDHTKKEEHIIAANEGNAVAIGIGYHLATDKIPLIYMQNSGLGNAINPLLSLADPDVYSIPLLMMIGWRGEPGVKDEPQHKKQGRVTATLLEAMEIPYQIVTADQTIDDVQTITRDLLKQAKEQKKPVALLIKKNVFEKYSFEAAEKHNYPLSREQVIEMISNTLSRNDVIVSTTGVTSRELFEQREKEDQNHSRDFLTVGGMGHTSQIALGIAIQQKERQIYCLDGDGSVIMHMGSLGINAAMNCKNFKHIVLNNGVHDSVGGQETVGYQIDIENIAKSSGYVWAKAVSCEAEVKESIKKLTNIDGPALLEIRIKKGFRKDLGRPIATPNENREELKGFIGK